MIMKEIGSEFWSVPICEEDNGYFDTQTQWFLSGRSALACILTDICKTRAVKTAALPAWCCDSMVKPFADAGISVKFYPVFFENGRFIQNLDAAGDCDILFVMDYFGYSGPDVQAPADTVVIRDLTHSIFSAQHTDARYCFGSLRKWAGFYTGGFAWGVEPQGLPENREYIALRSSAMAQKTDYISGKIFEKGYLGIFGQAEDLLEESLPARAAERDVQLANLLDIGALRQQRRSNAAQLLEAFGELAIFPELKEDDCPLFVPILVPQGKRDELRKFLIQNSIYCPVHWPLTQYHRPDEKSAAIYRDGLSLICDQRYGEEDMSRLIETVKRFWKD